MNSPTSQDFEINITPIIDCFTVLITFLLVSASFISLGVFDSNLNQSMAGTNSGDRPLIVKIKNQGLIQYHFQGITKTINPLENGDYDLESLLKLISPVSNSTSAPLTSNLQKIEIQTEDSVLYESFIKIYDGLQPKASSLSIGGE